MINRPFTPPTVDHTYESISKLYNTESRIFYLENNISHLHSSFTSAINDLNLTAQLQAERQQCHDAALLEILHLLKSKEIGTPQRESDTNNGAPTTDMANNPQ